ncbi:dual specificity protein phosphatase family protein [Reyranella sp. MMS21-HV4-11]|uniref:Dual specificity protein phosphatase family protein n=1 Tax=Reyranella humidisoli TaxID=2849149 RepID=A0ABS6IPK4_9HYPH|nr:protein-tyrosine phosphatase family protein [Reyranella sp. MMS21-HV4-11]MBU8875115.1 dual specificity protein phosphatase family protein [Reyranella sp. MMS21-HV4-11]
MALPLFKVTICGIPELPQHCAVGVSHVLSIIDTHEPRPPALDTYRSIDHELIRFDDVVAEYPGFEACTPAHIEQVLAFGERVHARPDGHVLVHCHAGISRSTAAAAILMTQFAPGNEEEAFLKLLDLRKHGWPNTRMIEFADTLLKRDGAMLRGLVAYRKALLDVKPHLKDVVRNIGRGHEIPT